MTFVVVDLCLVLAVLSAWHQVVLLQHSHVSQQVSQDTWWWGGSPVLGSCSPFWNQTFKPLPFPACSAYSQHRLTVFLWRDLYFRSPEKMYPEITDSALGQESCTMLNWAPGPNTGHLEAELLVTRLDPGKARERFTEMTSDPSILISARVTPSFWFDLLIPSPKKWVSCIKTLHPERQSSKRRALPPFINQPPFLSPSPAPYLLPPSDACLRSSGLFGLLPGDLTAILLSSDTRGKEHPHPHLQCHIEGKKATDLCEQMANFGSFEKALQQHGWTT